MWSTYHVVLRIALAEDVRQDWRMRLRKNTDEFDADSVLKHAYKKYYCRKKILSLDENILEFIFNNVYIHENLFWKRSITTFPFSTVLFLASLFLREAFLARTVIYLLYFVVICLTRNLALHAILRLFAYLYSELNCEHTKQSAYTCVIIEK